MTDTISVEHRSWVMSQIHSENTKPEMLVRSFLHRNGFRFRLHVKKLPGRPDIVLAKYKTVVEVRGCFWHHHENCKSGVFPKSHSDFWIEKFRKNTERDARNENALKELGWNVIVVWECELKERLHDLPMLIRAGAKNHDKEEIFHNIAAEPIAAYKTSPSSK